MTARAGSIRLLLRITVVLLLLAPLASAEVVIDWVIVANPSNPADGTGYGAVPGSYRISKYETTNAQYVKFLNAIWPHFLPGPYQAEMGSGVGGITETYIEPLDLFFYSVTGDRGDKPVNFLSFYDSLRFANWLHNGQPKGPQGVDTSEDGAYDLTLGENVTRKPGARVFLPSEDEWYKAAYYDEASGYFAYPAGVDPQTTCDAPGASANTANCLSADVEDVGSYTGSAGPYGTFDQGGNVSEWNEASFAGGKRGVRGGAFNRFPAELAASDRGSSPVTAQGGDLGFRVASVIPPPAPALGPVGIAILLGVLGATAYWRLRDSDSVS